MRRNALVGTAAFVALLLAVVLVAHDAIVAAVLRAAVALQGYELRLGSLHVGLSSAVAQDVRVTDRADESVLYASRVQLRYAVRDLLPGSHHRFGLVGVDVADPELTLIHHADGTYNVKPPPSSPTPAAANAPPIDVIVHLHGGSVLFVDRFVHPGRERRERIVGLTVDGRFSSQGNSRYTAGFALNDGRANYPVRGVGRFFPRLGLGLQHWTAARLPIGPLIDFAFQSHAIVLADGELLDVDAHLDTVVDPDGSVHAMTAASAQLARGRVEIAALAKPVRDARGTLRAYDDGLTTSGIDATLAGVPLHLVGGVYGLSNPHVQFYLDGHGPIAALRGVAPAAQRQPLDGDLTFALRAVGPAMTPLVRGTFAAPTMSYGAFRFDRPSGAIAVQGRRLDLLYASVAYGPLAIRAAGSLQLEQHVRTNLAVTLDGNGDELPYVAQIVPGLQLAGALHVSGVGERLQTSGTAFGSGRAGDLSAFFHVDGAGDGVVGPLAVDRTDGASLYARVGFYRRHRASAGIVSATNFSLLPARLAPLPGLHLAELPSIAGTVNAALVGTVDDAQLSAASGRLQLSNARVGPIRGSATANVGPTANGMLGASVHARSTLGDLDLNAAYGAGRLAAVGHLRSSFDRLRSVVGNLPGRGAVDIELRALADGSSAALQIAKMQFTAANVEGVALRDGDATVTLRDGRYDVRAARLGVDGGNVIAQGQVGNDADLRAWARVGPLLAHVHVGGRRQAPNAAIGVVVSAAHLHGVDVSGSADLQYDDRSLRIDGARALAVGGYLIASGMVGGLGRPSPEVDLRADLFGAQIAQIDRVYPLHVPYPEGEIDADLHASGPARSPDLAGNVQIPVGSINGQAFRDGHAAFHGGLRGLAVDHGGVTVGGTTVSFNGDFSSAYPRLSLRAPALDLADFNNSFAGADTLAGRGHALVAVSGSPVGLQTQGDVALEDFRVRRFALGTTSAVWHTTGRTIDASTSVRTDRGTARLAARATLPSSEPLRDPLHRVSIDATGTLADLDIAAWLPPAQVFLPIAGIVNASAQVEGTFAAPAFDAQASVASGVAAGYHLDAATIAMNGNAQVVHLTSLHVAGPGLLLDADGSAGYAANDPVGIALHAQSDDLALLQRAARVPLGLGGAVSTDVHVSGTRAAPRVALTADATHLTYGGYALTRVHANALADERTVRLNELEADFAKGRLSASATIPIALAPSFGLRNAPLSATLRAEAIDLGEFASALPANSKLAGTIAGEVTAGGTPSDPSIDGSLALSDGSYSSDLVRSAFTNARARLTFTHSQAQLSDVHADVGGGSVEGSGTASFGDLRNFAHNLALRTELIARNVRLDIDRYLLGTVNGTLTATKPANQPTATIAGDVAFSQTRIPLRALLPNGKQNQAATPLPIPIAFDVRVQAGSDVRVVGDGVNIGARGAVTVGGTLASPTLSGSIASTDGTISMYRTFVIQRGLVTFTPSDGLIPNVDATATTTISNPDTDILLQVSGPVTNLQLALSSNPTYSREQILGLLVNAQAFGAVSGIQTSQASGGNGFSASTLVGGYLSSQLTQSILQPFGSRLGSSLGLSNLALGYDFGSGLSAGATTTISQNLTASFRQTFGVDQREILGFNYTVHRDSALQLSLFTAGLGSRALPLGQFLESPDPFSPNLTLEALSPPPGASGVVFTYQRSFP